MQKRILAIINSFNIDKATYVLIDTIKGWLNQKLPDNIVVDLVISDVASRYEERLYVQTFIKSQLDKKSPNIRIYTVEYDKVNPHAENLSVYITFNATIKLFNQFEYDYFIYNSEDCILNTEHCLSIMLNEFENKNVGIVSALVDNDNSQLYPHYNIYNPQNSSTVKIGESVNMHFFIFSKFFMQQYNYKYTDVLIAFATESMLTFFTAAINAEWIHCSKIMLQHKRNAYSHKGLHGWHIFRNFTTFHEMFSEGVNAGLGFECHDNKQFPFSHNLYSGNKCLNPEKLHKYIKEKLFLPKEVFNYMSILSHATIKDFSSPTKCFR